MHEDLGAHPRCLDTALTVADAYDVQVALHTDGLNEAGCVADTLAVAGGRVFHAFHGLDPERDSALARDRIRAGTMAAEGPLHDLGVIPITSSDAQGMGRAGETVRRTFGLASVMKRAAGSPGPDDNERVLRYLAKLTINPAVAHEVGSVEVGKLADIVLWDPAWFGAKPTLVLKAGVPAWGATGDPNAAIDIAEPLVLGPQSGACGATGRTTLDDDLLFVEAAESVPLSRLYFL